jgi:hypothetical protein
MADCLTSLRRRLSESATPDGEFYVACAETGDRPVPLTGRNFPTEDAAREAADVARRYRAVLRDADSELPERRLAVYQHTADGPTLVSTREEADGKRENGLPRTTRSVTLSGEDEREWLRMENAPLVHVSRDGTPLDDDAIARQLDSKL